VSNLCDPIWRDKSVSPTRPEIWLAASITQGFRSIWIALTAPLPHIDWPSWTPCGRGSVDGDIGIEIEAAEMKVDRYLESLLVPEAT